MQTPEWILVAGLSAPAQALYTALLAHVNRQKADGVAWPGLATLAAMLGYRKRQSITPYLDELVALNAIDVENKPCRSGRRNEYVVHEVPPEDYPGFRTLGEFHAHRRDVAEQGRMSAPADIAMSAVPDEGMSAPADTNQKKPTRRKNTEVASSGDAYAAGAPRASSQGQRDQPPEIEIPPGFDQWDDGKAAQYLVGAAIRVMTDRGLDADGRAGDAMARVLKHQCVTREDMVRNARYWSSVAGTNEPNGGWLASRRAAS